MMKKDSYPYIRSLLFCPANREDQFEKALQTEADLVVYDLEDAVAFREKNAARKSIFKWLEAKENKELLRTGIRINDLYTKNGLLDLLALQDVNACISYVMLPKIESSEQIIMAEKLLCKDTNSLFFIALIESARGIQNIDQIVNSSERIAFVMMGNADLSADLLCENNRRNLCYASQRTLIACSSTKIPVIDSPCFNLKDEQVLITDTALGKKMGFSAKAAIHPKQISVINQQYTPTQKEIENAQEILSEAKKGVGIFNGQMIDEAMAKKARRIIKIANRISP